MREDRFEYDIQKRAKAGTAATFRVLVSAYLIYLGWTILKGVLNGSSSVPAWAGWLAAIVFTAAAAAFGVYTWKTWRRDLNAARLPEYDGTGEEDPADAEEEENCKEATEQQGENEP